MPPQLKKPFYLSLSFYVFGPSDHPLCVAKKSFGGMFVFLQNMYILKSHGFCSTSDRIRPLLPFTFLFNFLTFSLSDLDRILWPNGCRLNDCGLELQLSQKDKKN